MPIDPDRSPGCPAIEEAKQMLDAIDEFRGLAGCHDRSVTWQALGYFLPLFALATVRAEMPYPASASLLAVRRLETTKAMPKTIENSSTMVGAGALSMKNER